MSFRHVVEPRDADRVRKLVSATGFFRPDEIDIAVELVAEALAKGRDSGYRFVFADAPEGPDLDGYACYGPVPATQSGFDLYWIAVSPTVQRQGLGRRLLAATEVEVRGEGGQRLYADTSGRPDYAPTRAFYHRSGFVVAAVFPDFYADGDDKVVFSKALG
jgi:D-alanine-D-alanine ligase